MHITQNESEWQKKPLLFGEQANERSCLKKKVDVTWEKPWVYPLASTCMCVYVYTDPHRYVHLHTYACTHKLHKSI